MTQGRANHAIRKNAWRYIRYANGAEELYDHRNDPDEFDNLVGNPTFDDVKRELMRHLPSEDAPHDPALEKSSSK